MDTPTDWPEKWSIADTGMYAEARYDCVWNVISVTIEDGELCVDDDHEFQREVLIPLPVVYWLITEHANSVLDTREAQSS